MRLSPNRRARRAIGFGLLGLLLIACSPATRHKTLIFFFDGVDTMKTKAGSLPFSLQNSQRVPVKPRPTPLPIVSRHKPWVQRQCQLCHEKGGGYVPITISADLCDRCHKAQREREKWNHGPINLGTCIPCHQPHESPYPHLLDQPVPDVCLICHADDLKRKEKYHQVANIKNCVACHDPHRKS